jgi:hypothetical protein
MSSVCCESSWLPMAAASMSPAGPDCLSSGSRLESKPIAFAAVLQFGRRRFAVVRRGSPEYGSAPPGQSSIRRNTPKFALTAVKLLSKLLSVASRGSFQGPPTRG